MKAFPVLKHFIILLLFLFPSVALADHYKDDQGRKFKRGDRTSAESQKHSLQEARGPCPEARGSRLEARGSRPEVGGSRAGTKM